MLYHGTSGVNSDCIVKSGFKIPQEGRADHWLGNGIYFFREDKSQALSWAISRYKKVRSVSEFHVIEVLLEVAEENFLNLDSRDGIDTYQSWGAQILSDLKSNGIELEFSSEEMARCFIIDSMPAQYTVIQRTFPGKSVIFDENPVLKMSGLGIQGVQVCVRSEEAINGTINVVIKEPRRRKKVKRRKLNIGLMSYER